MAALSLGQCLTFDFYLPTCRRFTNAVMRVVPQQPPPRPSIVESFRCTAQGFKGYTLHIVKESEVAQSCATLCDPMDCSLPGSSIHGIFQARVLEWGAVSFSRGSSRLRNQTQVSCIAGRCLPYPLSHQGSLLYLQLLYKCAF